MTNRDLIETALKGYLHQKTGTRLIADSQTLVADWMGDRVVVRSYGVRIASIFGIPHRGDRKVEIDGEKHSQTTSRHVNLIKARLSPAEIHVVKTF